MRGGAAGCESEKVDKESEGAEDVEMRGTRRGRE